MKISIIVSVSENWVIGNNNKLLWRLSGDLKNFRELTSGHPVIMGQKTFESLPNGALPNRTNIVLTDDPDFKAPDIIPAYSIDDSLEVAEHYLGPKWGNWRDNEVFIIGGGMIYKQFLEYEYVDCVYLTKVHINIEGDTTFPELDTEQWELVSEVFQAKDNKNEYDHTYQIYNKK